MTAVIRDGGLDAVPRIRITPTSAAADHAAATPSIAVVLDVAATAGAVVRSMIMQVQVRIDVRRRSYDAATRARLRELFGTPEQWATSLESVLWTQTSLIVQPFEGRTQAILDLPCSYDFEVSACKLLHALRDGSVPLSFLFNGTLFYLDDEGALRTALLPWEDARFDMPVAAWWQAMDRFFPSSAWLRVDRTAFDRLYAYRNQRSLPSWEATLSALLDAAEVHP